MSGLMQDFPLILPWIPAYSRVRDSISSLRPIRSSRARQQDVKQYASPK